MLNAGQNLGAMIRTLWGLKKFSQEALTSETKVTIDVEEIVKVLLQRFKIIISGAIGEIE